MASLVMAKLDLLMTAWNEAYREFSIALDNMPDDDLWRRAHPRLLSVGELAGHVAYWQAVWILGGGSDRPNLDQMPIKSLLLDHGFRYYTGTVEQPFQVDLNAAQVLSEVVEIHAAGKAAVGDRDSDDEFPGMWRTWGALVQYQVFHVAYHTGQVYSVRHLLGHETEDN